MGNQLVYLPGVGEFQMKQIDAPQDPYPLKKKRAGTNVMEDADMEEGVKVVAVADPSRQHSLVTEAEIDPMEGEQTWPTEEELREADEAAALLEKEEEEQKTKKIPKGMSEYQAAWIVDEEEENEEEDDSGKMMMIWLSVMKRRV